MIQNGILSREEAENHPLSNMLTNCVGAVADLQIEFYLEKVQKGDRYMFCSDGLSSMIDDELIMKKIRDNDKASTSVDELIKQALRHGGGDNVTVVCAFL